MTTKPVQEYASISEGISIDVVTGDVFGDDQCILGKQMHGYEQTVNLVETNNRCWL